MTNAWEEYFTGPVRPVEGGVNWEAYSHEELYDMLWQDADVADVSTVATEWAKHRTALTTHAEVLREQCAALRDSWEGPGADEAVRRLENLAARVGKISELAAAGALAAQDAADALATARAMMPAPPGRSAVPIGTGQADVPAVSTVSVPQLPASSSVSSLQSYMSSMQSYLSSMQSSFAQTMSTPMFAPAPTSTTPSSTAPDMGAAFGAVGSGGASFYFGAVTEDQQKAQAVQAMRNYESSLTNSSQMLGDARGAVPAATTTTASAAGTTAATAAGTTTPGQGTGGVPWQQLVGGSTGGGMRGGAGVGAVIGAPATGTPLEAGARVGGLPGAATGPGPQVARLAETAAASRASGPAGMVPPVGRRGANDEDERHENRMPTLDHGLFTVDDPGISVVMDLTGGQS